MNLPPSSPLYYEDQKLVDQSSDLETDSFVHEKSSLKQQVSRGLSVAENLDYPTPEPSSSLGNLGSSSPFREDDYELDIESYEAAGKQLEHGPKVVEFSQPSDMSYHTLDAARDHFVDVAKESKKMKKMRSKRLKKIKLAADGQPVSIGRSLICDVVLSDSKNLVSRKHAAVHYDKANDMIVAKCYGVNALEVQIPVQAKVKYLGERRKFELVPENSSEYQKFATMKYKDLVYKGLTKFSRGLSQSNGTSRFLVLPNEVLKVPRMSSVILDIRGSICLVQVADQNDPDLTDEEDMSIQHADYVVLSKAHESKQYNAESAEIKTEIPTISLDKIKQLVGDVKNQKKRARLATKIETKELKKPKIEKDFKELKKPKIEKDFKKSKIGYDYQDPKTLIDAVNKDEKKKQQLLLEISDLQDIKKVLVNHLAFSRLASTPLSLLMTISKKIETLNKREVRLVLSDIRCVGIIYRKGKDAAGKPLDEEYYYSIEEDDDQDRVQLVNSVKGGSSLRSCRKTHKQYYWKRPPPLPRY